jgi:hypothetical protein
MVDGMMNEHSESDADYTNVEFDDLESVEFEGKQKN